MSFLKKLSVFCLFVYFSFGAAYAKDIHLTSSSDPYGFRGGRFWTLMQGGEPYTGIVFSVNMKCESYFLIKMKCEQPFLEARYILFDGRTLFQSSREVLFFNSKGDKLGSLGGGEGFKNNLFFSSELYSDFVKNPDSFFVIRGLAQEDYRIYLKDFSSVNQGEIDRLNSWNDKDLKEERGFYLEIGSYILLSLVGLFFVISLLVFLLKRIRSFFSDKADSLQRRIVKTVVEVERARNDVRKDFDLEKDKVAQALNDGDVERALELVKNMKEKKE